MLSRLLCLQIVQPLGEARRVRSALYVAAKCQLQPTKRTPSSNPAAALSENGGNARFPISPSAHSTQASRDKPRPIPSPGIENFLSVRRSSIVRHFSSTSATLGCSFSCSGGLSMVARLDRTLGAFANEFSGIQNHPLRSFHWRAREITVVRALYFFLRGPDRRSVLSEGRWRGASRRNKQQRPSSTITLFIKASTSVLAPLSPCDTSEPSS